MSRTYIAMLRVAFRERSELHAQRTAEHIQSHVESELEPRDTCVLTQVVPFGDVERPDEVIIRLKIARNELLRLKYKDTHALAQQLDIIICKLASLAGEEDVAPDYDWNRIVALSDAVARGEDPLT